MLARFGLVLVLTLAGLAARADSGVLPVHSLEGPFPSLAAYCAQRRRQDDSEGLQDCSVAQRRGHTAVVVLRFAADHRFADLALEDGAGWWIDESILYQGNPGHGSFFIETIGDAGLRAVQSDWWKPLGDAESERFDHDVYYCFALEARCWPRPDGPVCSDALPVAGRRDCGLGDEHDAASFVGGRWDWEQQIRDSAGGREVQFVRRGWRHFPTSSHGYGEWFARMTSRARSLGGTRRRVVVEPPK